MVDGGGVTMVNAIETTALTKQFAPGVGAVDVGMAVRTGSVYGFLGPNGAGKSTTIRMLTGMLRPDSGTVRVLGLDPAVDAVGLKHRIGVVSSDQRLPRHHSGGSLLRLLARLRDDDTVVDRGRALAERLDLDLDKPGHTLSLGNRQKVGIVTALAHDPELTIMDEPTSGLDPLLQREVEAIVRELTDRGRTVVLSSHSLPEVERIADDVGFIRQAQLVEQAPLATLAQRAVRRAVVQFDAPVTADAFAGVDNLVDARASGDGTVVSLTWQGPVAPLLLRAGELGAVTIEARGADLEATFMSMYDRSADPGTPVEPPPDPPATPGTPAGRTTDTAMAGEEPR